MYGRAAMPAVHGIQRYCSLRRGAGIAARPYVLFEWDLAGYNSEN